MVECVEAGIAGADHQYFFPGIIRRPAEMRRMDDLARKILHAFPGRDEGLPVASGGDHHVAGRAWFRAGLHQPVVAAEFDFIDDDAEGDRQPVRRGEVVEEANYRTAVRKGGGAFRKGNAG